MFFTPRRNPNADGRLNLSAIIPGRSRQSFEYHAEKMRSWPELPALKAKLAAVNSLYTPSALESLGGP